MAASALRRPRMRWGGAGTCQVRAHAGQARAEGPGRRETRLRAWRNATSAKRYARWRHRNGRSSTDNTCVAPHQQGSALNATGHPQIEAVLDEFRPRLRIDGAD